MLHLQGTVLSVLRRDPREGRDGKQYAGYGQVQLQTEEILDDGQVKFGLQTLSCDLDQVQAYEALSGKVAVFPVRAYVRGGSVAFALGEGRPFLASQMPMGA